MSLAAVLARYEKGAPLEFWRETHCLRFALECAAASGRTDLTDLVPNFRDQRAARRALVALRVPTLAALLDRFARRIPAGMGLPGDVTQDVSVGGEKWGALGVVLGVEAAFLGRDKPIERKRFQTFPVWRLDCPRP